MALGMVYGTGAIIIYTLIKSTPFVLPTDLVYWLSLLYLVIPGSIIAFLCYLKLIKNIGPALAGYTTVLFPIVALIISSIFEAYDWSIADFIGLSLVIGGNILVMRQN